MKKLFTLCLISALVFKSYGQTTIAAWNSFGLTNYGPSPFAPTTLLPNVNSGGLVRGDSIRTSGSAGANLWGGTNWSLGTFQNAIDSSKYVTFSVTPQLALGGVFSVAALDSIKIRVTATGPIYYLLQYSIVPGVFADLATYTIVRPSSTTNFVLPPTPLTINVPLLTTVTFRIVPFGATNTGGAFYIGNQSSTNHLAILGQVVLPVSLASFTATVNDNKSLLRWTTVSEVNFSRFEVEKSLDGRGFSNIGTLEATGSSNRNNYQLVDDATLQAQQYYRLKMIDNDGTFKYSAVVGVYGKESIGITAYPNPATNAIVLTHPKAEKGAFISIINTDGKITASYIIGENALQSRLALESLPKGNYTIVYHNNGNNQTTRLIKL